MAEPTERRSAVAGPAVMLVLVAAWTVVLVSMCSGDARDLAAEGHGEGAIGFLAMAYALVWLGGLFVLALLKFLFSRNG